MYVVQVFMIMLYAKKRNSLTSLKTLGPPLRASHKEEEVNDTLPVPTEENDILPHTDSPLEPAGLLTWNPSSVLRVVVNNKENATPSMLKVTPHPAHRGTPNSTYPNSNGIVSRSSAAKEKGGQRSILGTPSSTFPVSSQEDANSSSTHHKTQNAPISQTTAGNHPYNGTPQFHHSTNSDATLISRSRSVPKQLCSVSKPPLDGHAHHSQQKHHVAPTIKQSLVVKQPHKEEMSATTGASPNPLGYQVKPLVLSSPEEDQNVVVLRSSDTDKRFKRVKLIGCGGSSKVYKVVALCGDYQAYALKEVYIKHADPAIKQAYINEIKLLKKLRGKPEIITLHDYDWNKQEGVLYILLEYAESDLNATIKSQQRIPPMCFTLFIWSQMLQVVKVIHDEGVIHNDLKPENFVFIGPQLRLIDFGIANKIETEKTSIERDIRCGTINYMSPETIETNEDSSSFKVGRPSDIWSLGCILYQLVYGKTPFEHIRNKMKKWHAITDPTVAIPFPEISNKAALDVMQKCLQRKPKERPTINELLQHPFINI